MHFLRSPFYGVSLLVLGLFSAVTLGAAQPAEPKLPESAVGRLGTLRFRNGGPLQAVRHLSNDKVVASVGLDQKLRFWNAETGELRSEFEPPVGKPVAFSPDGLWAAVTDGKDIVLYDTTTGKSTQRFSDSKLFLSNPAFSDDGKTLAAVLTVTVPTAEEAGVSLERKAKELGEMTAHLLTGMAQGEAGPAIGPRGIRVWDLTTGKPIRDLRAPAAFGRQPLSSVTPIFADDQVGFLGTRPGSGHAILLWGLKTGRLESQFAMPENALPNVPVISPDRKWAVVYTTDAMDNTIRPVACNLATGKVVYKLGEPFANGTAPQTIFSPDSKTVGVVELDGGQAHIFDLNTGKETSKFPYPNSEFGVATTAFSPDGSVFAVGMNDGALTLFDARKGKMLQELKGFRSAYNNNAIENVVVNINGFDLNPGTPMDANPLWQAPLSFTRDGKRVVGTGGSILRTWDVATGKEVKPAGDGHESAVGTIVFSLDGRWLATAGDDNTVMVWDRATGRVMHRFTGPASLNGQQLIEMPVVLALSPDSQFLAAGWFDGGIQVWDMNGKELRKIPAHEGSVNRLAFIPGGNMLASSGSDGNVFLWNLATGKRSHALAGSATGDVSDSESRVIAVSPDARLLGGFSMSGSNLHLRTWELATGKVRLDIKRPATQRVNGIHTSRVVVGGNRVIEIGGPDIAAGPLVFSPTGKTVALGYGKDLHLCDLARGREVRRFGVPAGAVLSAAFSPDGKVLAAAANSELYLWDVATGTVLGRRDGHRGATACVAFSPDGKVIATGGADSTVLLWDVAELLRAPAGPEALSPKDLAAVWDQLSSANATAAYGAMRRLREAPTQAVPLLKEKVPPVVAPDAQRLAVLVAQLDSDKEETRKQAIETLTQLNELAEAALRKRLDENPGDKTGPILERLLERLDRPIESGDQVRALRAVEVLEQIGTAEAKAVLRDLARGAAEARLTREAEAALARLKN